MHISTTSNTMFPIISIQDLPQTLNSIQIQPTTHLPFPDLPKESIQGCFREDTCPWAYHTSWELGSSVGYLAAPLVFGPQSNRGFPPSHSSFLLLFLITNLSGPNCLVNCLQSLHLTEIAAIVNRSLHFSPFSLTQFDSFTITTFPPKKAVIQWREKCGTTA